MGSSFYHVGWQQTPRPSFAGAQPGTVQATGIGALFSSGTRRLPYGGMAELEVKTAAWNEARRRALERLGEEGRLVGADAVVGETRRWTS